MPNQESIMNAFNFYYFISELIGLHNNQRNSAANFNSKLDNDLKRHLCVTKVLNSDLLSF